MTCPSGALNAIRHVRKHVQHVPKQFKHIPGVESDCAAYTQPAAVEDCREACVA